MTGNEMEKQIDEVISILADIDELLNGEMFMAGNVVDYAKHIKEKVQLLLSI